MNLTSTKKSSMSKTENQWRDSVLRPFLDRVGAVYFIKEAGSIRGLPDLVGVYKGSPFFLEIKRSESSMKHPRTMLQAHYLSKLVNAQAFAEFIYPENAREIMKKFFLKLLKENKIEEEEYMYFIKLITETFEVKQ